MGMEYGNARTFRRGIMRNGKLIKSLVILFFTTVFAACIPCGHDGPYKGRVVDEQTGAPIEGAVILGVWYKEYPSPGGTVGSYYDAQETVSDKTGAFEIKGLGTQMFSFVGSMNVLIFKAGYSQIGMGMWISHRHDGGLMIHKAKVEGDRVIFPVKKLTMEERRKRHCDKETVPDNKQRLLIKELNREYKELGIQLYPERD